MILSRVTVLTILLALTWTGCAKWLGITQSDPRDIEAVRQRGEAGECVDTIYSESLHCPSGQFVTEDTCQPGKVRCGASCFDVSAGKARCKGDSVVTTEACPLGQARCIPTECSPQTGGKKVACSPGQEVTSDGCPDGYIQCAPW